MATSLEGIDDGAGFGVKGSATAGDGIVGTTKGIHKAAVRGVHEGHISAIAVIGELDRGTAAVKGQAGGGSGGIGGDDVIGSGVWGDSSIGPGISGTSSASSGVLGQTATGSGVVGISGSGVGVVARSETGEGLHASSNSPGAAAVAGINLNSGPGVYGVSEKFDGVAGIAKGDGKAGVAGRNDNGIGVYGNGGHRAGLFEGDLEVTGVLHLGGGADYAEELPVGSQMVQPGQCVVLAEDGCVVPCVEDYDTRVAGVISGAGGMRPAIVLDHLPDDSGAPIALMGKAYVWVDADRSPVRVGDVLVSSSTPGHAMAVSDHARAFGAVIGKALTRLDSGRGLVKIFLASR